MAKKSMTMTFKFPKTKEPKVPKISIAAPKIRKAKITSIKFGKI